MESGIELQFNASCHRETRKAARCTTRYDFDMLILGCIEEGLAPVVQARSEAGGNACQIGFW